MASLRNLVIATLTLFASTANGKRVNISDDAEQTLNTVDAAEYQTLADTSFVCPAECTQCCVATWAFSLFDSRSSFKCVLAPGKEMPEDGRECGEPEARNSDPNAKKIECAFTEQEKNEGAHALMGRCTTSSHQFQCPDECQECCQAGEYLNMRTSRDKFKCILKNAYKGGNEVSTPPSRTCGEVKKRNSVSIQAKTECEYTDGEKSADAWQSLQRCSSGAKCCCDETENWSETLCLPLDKQNERETYLSETSEVVETYARGKTSFDNTDTACRNPDSKQVPFDKWTDARYPKNDYYGCCLKTKMTTALYRWSEREAYSCTKKRWVGRHSHSYRATCHRTVRKSSLHPVEVCDEFETLYQCSGEGTRPDGKKDTKPKVGIHRTGNLYMRISTKQGQCISNEPLRKAGDLRLTTQGRCPKNFARTVTGMKCQCETAC